MPKAEKTQRKGRGKHPNSLANLKPFTKGESGNPEGMEPGTKHRGTILRKWAEAAVDIVNPLTKEKERGTVEDEVILGLIREARKGNVPAIKEFLDTLYGKIPNKEEHSGPDGKPIQSEKVVRIELID